MDSEDGGSNIASYIAEGSARMGKLWTKRMITKTKTKEYMKGYFKGKKD